MKDIPNVHKKLAQELESLYITVEEAAKLHKCHRVSMYELVQRGRVRHTSIFGKLIILKEDIVNFKKQKTGPRLDIK